MGKSRPSFCQGPHIKNGLHLLWARGHGPVGLAKPYLIFYPLQWQISMRAESIAFCHGLHSSARARERERERERENVPDQKILVRFYIPLNPNNQARIDMTQQPNPFTLKPRLNFNPTQAKPTTKIYQQPNPKIILLYKIPNPKIRIS